MIWNLTQVVVVIVAGIVLLENPLDPGTAAPDTIATLARAFAVGTLAGGLLQFLIQLPAVRRLEPRLRVSLRRDLPGVRRVTRAFTPVVAGRGVVQISAYVDLVLASLLAGGAVSAIYTSQVLYMLPIALFGMSVAAAELPELSRGEVSPDAAARLDEGLTTMAFWVAGSAVIFVVAGDFVAGALFTTGQFGRPEEVLVWILLAGFSVGLLATTSSRLLQSALYAAGDTRTPARIAAQRVGISLVVALVLMFPLDRLVIAGEAIQHISTDTALWFPLPAGVRENPSFLHIGALGLIIGGVVAAWYEFNKLAAAVRRRTGVTLFSGGSQRGHLVLPALAGAIVGLVLRPLLADLPRLVGGPLIVLAIGATYVLVATRTRVEEAADLLETVRRRLTRSG